MLRIRRAQMKALKRDSIRPFVERMVVHLGTFFPEESAAVGEERVRAVIRYGIDRAEHYGIVNNYDVCRYLNLMFTFGHDFDMKCAWASGLLGMAGRMSAEELMEELYDTALENAEDAQGISQNAEGYSFAAEYLRL